jgi:hypothetical protein
MIENLTKYGSYVPKGLWYGYEKRHLHLNIIVFVSIVFDIFHIKIIIKI